MDGGLYSNRDRFRITQVLTHKHMVSYLGTYTQGNNLSTLGAVCHDLKNKQEMPRCERFSGSSKLWSLWVVKNLPYRNRQITQFYIVNDGEQVFPVKYMGQ